MTQNRFFLSIAFFSALGLASCDMFSGGSGGTEVKHPTVDQMAELEKKWGVQPREVRSRHALPPSGAGELAPAPPQSGAPQVAPPDTVPLPQTATPPVFEPPPQPATPAQIQKLKN